MVRRSMQPSDRIRTVPNGQSTPSASFFRHPNNTFRSFRPRLTNNVCHAIRPGEQTLLRPQACIHRCIGTGTHRSVLNGHSSPETGIPIPCKVPVQYLPIPFPGRTRKRRPRGRCMRDRSAGGIRPCQRRPAACLVQLLYQTICRVVCAHSVFRAVRSSCKDRSVLTAPGFVHTIPAA
jgi:hypothetical protein